MRLNATRLGSIASSRSFGDQLDDLAGQVPSLDLQLATTKSLVDAVTGAQLVTHTRASSATFTGSNGLIQTASTNEPRFDHDPTTGESLGLLVEEARTNLLLRSEEFDNASWLKSNVTITANTIVSPDGTVSADTFTGAAGTNIKRIRQTVATTSLGPWTFSTWLKTNTAASALIVLFDPTGGGTNHMRTTLSFSTGGLFATAASGTVTGASASVQSFGNGWYRVSITGTFGTALTSVSADVWLDGFTTTANETSFYLWGAQLEAGAFPTSYIPTVAATVTRAADVASITGANFSSWFNEITGSFYSSTSILGRNQTASTATLYANGIFKIKNNTVNSNLSRTHHYHVDATQRIMAGARDASGIQFLSENTLSISTGSVYSMASAYTNASTDAAISVNGRTPVNASSSTSITLTGLTTMLIGAGYFGAIGGGAPGGDSMYLNGHIRRLAYWPTRLSNEVLQRITQ